MPISLIKKKGDSNNVIDSAQHSFKYFISPLSCSSRASLCDVSEENPYDNIIDAFYRARNLTLPFFDSEIIFFLSEMRVVQGSTYFLNEEDIPTAYLSMLRSTTSSFHMKPLYCSDFSTKYCIKNEKLKPPVFIRTDKVSMFVQRDVSFVNLIFDASDSVIPQRRA